MWLEKSSLERLHPAHATLAISAYFSGVKSGSTFADHYLLFDLPGQVELFTLHAHVKNVIDTMVSKWNFRVR